MAASVVCLEMLLLVGYALLREEMECLHGTQKIVATCTCSSRWLSVSQVCIRLFGGSGIALDLGGEVGRGGGGGVRFNVLCSS